MGTFIYIIVVTVALAILLAVGWRLGSRRYKLPCPAWLRWCVELDNPFSKTCRAATIVEHLGLSPGMVVLDAGCGPGRLTIPLARQVGANGVVVAMDLQAGMLTRVQEKAQAENLFNIEFLHAGLGEGKLAKARFDRVLLVTVLGEIPDRKKALQEIFAALKPGGILSVTELIFDPHFQRRSTVASLAGEVGFREKDFYGQRLAFTMHLEKPRNT